MGDGRLKCGGCCVMRKAGVVIYVCPDTDCAVQPYFAALPENKIIQQTPTLNTCFT